MTASESIEILPKELLIEIFHHLDSVDLLALTLTCKKFNAIISSSSRLTENLELQFTPKNVNCEWRRSRRLTKAFLDGSVVGFFTYIVAAVGGELRELTIDCYDVDVLTLRQVLLMCANLRKLWVYNVMESSEDERDYRGQLPALDLELLYFQGEIGVFRILKNCRARTLDVRRDYEDESRNVEGLKHFLRAQDALESLSLEYFDRNSSLFDEDLSARFRLKRLKLKYFDDFGSFFFREFVEQQRESLAHLEASHVHHDLLALFRRLGGLRSLKVRAVCSGLDDMPAVEELAVRDLSGTWSDKFPAVRSLTVDGHHDGLEQIERLKALESLTLRNCAVPALKLPTVKRLTLHRVAFLDGDAADAAAPFDFGAGLEELTVVRSKRCDWLVHLLAHKDCALRSLRVEKSKLADDDRRRIEELRAGAGRRLRLAIINCQGVTDEEIDEDVSGSEEEEDGGELSGNDASDDDGDAADGEEGEEEEDEGGERRP